MTAYADTLIQDAPDGPGPLTQADDGKLMMWDNATGRFTMAALRMTGGGAVRAMASRIQDAPDGPGSLGSGDNGKALVWDNATGRFVMTAFEASGAAAAAVAAHVAESDPHTQYLLATGSRTGASSQAQTFTNGIVGPTWKPASDSTTAMQMTPSAGGTFMTLDTVNRRIYIDDGSTPAAAILPGDAFNVSASGTNAISATIVASNTTTQRGIFRGVRARGTVGSPSAVAAGDTVFSFLSAGYDGAALQNTALIEFLVDSGTVSSGVLPQKIIFVTGETNSASRAERLVIKANGFVGIGLGTGATPTGRLHVGGAASASAWGTAGIEFQVASGTFTDSSTASGGTATNAVANSFGRPTFAASNTTVTMTNAATLYIANSPAAGTNVTLTNAYALWVDDGAVRLDGNVGFFATAPAAKQTVTGSRGSNAALASLLTALAAYGLITDSSS